MLYKRSKKAGAPWWVRFTIRGREIRVSSGTNSRPAAEEFERRLRDQVWREKALGEIIYTWEDAKARWLEEKSQKRSLDRDKQAFEAVEGELQGQALADIDVDRLAKVRSAIMGGSKRNIPVPRKPGTVNRSLAVVRGVLNAAVRWGWLTHAPKIQALQVEKGPPRWITQDQFEKLCDQLPPHAQAMARFAVAVGARARNVNRLRWSAVDLQRRVFHVESGEFKGRRTVGFPLSDQACAVLVAQQGKHPEFVFADQRGRAPIRSIKTCWLKAVKRAGLDGFRFHDLRHTWAAWHKQAGTPNAALKELGGWSDSRMIDRYGHINPTDYAQYSDNRRTKDGTSGSGNGGK